MSASSRAASSPSDSESGSGPEHNDAARSTERQLSNYRRLVRDLGARTRGGLAAHLAQRSQSPVQQDDEDDEGEQQHSSDYASAQESIEAPQQRKRRRPLLPKSDSLDEYSTRWPLHPSELGDDDATLAEAVTDFASACIRQHGLRLPHAPALEEGEDPVLPLGLETRVIESVNTILIRLAAAQAPLSRSQRLIGPPLALRTVLEIAAQGCSESVLCPRFGALLMCGHTIDQVSDRLRPRLTQDQDISLLLHRRKLAATAQKGSYQSANLYAPIRPLVGKKAHQSAAELARRAEKRQLSLRARQKDA